MKVETVDNHSFYPDLLTSGGTVLDVGCRGFGFSRVMAERGMKVLALDPDAGIKDPGVPGVTFVCKALMDDPALRVATYASWSSGEGNYVVRSGRVPAHAEASEVQCVDIVRLMGDFGVTVFDLAKFDCEGSEYGVLLRWPGPIARQISVEFHDFLGMNPSGNDHEAYYKKLFAHIGQWYDVVQHEKFVHPLMVNGPENYWDSLFVLRNKTP